MRVYWLRVFATAVTGSVLDRVRRIVSIFHLNKGKGYFRLAHTAPNFNFGVIIEIWKLKLQTIVNLVLILWHQL